MTNEAMHSSSFTDETKDITAFTNEAFSEPAAVYSVARFGKSKFGDGIANSGGPASPHTNETKNSASFTNEAEHSSSEINETKH